MKLLVVYLVVLLVCVLGSMQLNNLPEKLWKCDEEDKLQIDKLASKILGFGEMAQKFPENKDELIIFCNKQYAMISLLEQYKNQCATGKRKQIITLTVYSMRNWNNQYCRSSFESRLSQKLLASSPCANQASGGYRLCYAQFVNQLVKVRNSTNPQRQLAKMCCSYIRTFECMKVAAEPFEVCTESHLEWNEHYIRLLFDNVTNFICGQYNDVTDKCDKLWKLSKSSTKWHNTSVSVHEMKPFFNTILDILTND